MGVLPLCPPSLEASAERAYSSSTMATIMQQQAAWGSRQTVRGQHWTWSGYSAFSVYAWVCVCDCRSYTADSLAINVYTSRPPPLGTAGIDLLNLIASMCCCCGPRTS